MPQPRRGIVAGINEKRCKMFIVARIEHSGEIKQSTAGGPTLFEAVDDFNPATDKSFDPGELAIDVTFEVTPKRGKQLLANPPRHIDEIPEAKSILPS